MRQTSGTARTAASTLTGKNPSPWKIRKVWPAPMANALSRARARAASSLPDQRTSRLPEASQKASPKRMPGNRAHQRFVEVFHGLDKMRLAEDEVGGVRLDDGHHGEFHGSAPAGRATQSMVGRRKVISRPHSRPILLLTTLPSTFRLPRGSRIGGRASPAMWDAIACDREVPAVLTIFDRLIPRANCPRRRRTMSGKDFIAGSPAHANRPAIWRG